MNNLRPSAQSVSSVFHLANFGTLSHMNITYNINIRICPLVPTTRKKCLYFMLHVPINLLPTAKHQLQYKT